MEKHIKIISKFIDDIVNEFVNKTTFDKYFGFIADEVVRHDMYLRHKYQLKQILYLKFLENEELLKMIETGILNQNVDNKIQKNMAIFTNEVNKPLNTEPITKIYDQMNKQNEERKMEEENDSPDEEIFTLLSDILNQSEDINNMLKLISQ